MNSHSLRWYPQNAPRKKLRGKRGYFRGVRKKASTFDLDFGEGAWWDSWHYHADWRGWGNLGWSYRLPHIEALCEVFRTIARHGSRFSTPFQAWISIDGENAGHDATFLHTPNPNGTPFPIRTSDIEADATTLGPVFSSLLPEMQLRFGWSRSRHEDEGVEWWSTAHWVWAEGVGLPLWTTRS